MKKLSISFYLLFLSIFLIIIGYLKDEVYLVFAKSIKICFECIGIG